MQMRFSVTMDVKEPVGDGEGYGEAMATAAEGGLYDAIVWAIGTEGSLLMLADPDSVAVEHRG